ncbi:MAG: hypothetical protein RLZZ371_1574 [Pseudomonadota bacterium]
MSDAGPDGRVHVQADPSADIRQQIGALRQAGAEQLEPVRLYHLQALADRASAYQGQVRQLLDSRLAQALQELKTCMAQAEGQAKPASDAPLSSSYHKPLAELVRHIAHHAPKAAEGGWDFSPTIAGRARPELKSIRYFRNTWSKLSVDRQVNKALDQAPKNAGPINSHMLVLRSLALMRELSPDYLNRFMSHVDTLLCLDQVDQAKQTTIRQAAERQASKKTAGRRTRRS